ncbi:NusG domain II-containing protein [Anaerocolumna jejuensis]|uniref:NusG domain II-containing protein n=1 Tax=Anaerocolumna jejuensis TaxID=259063 RepID=UPI003F7BB013
MDKNTYIKKKDIILLLVILFIALGGLLIFRITQKSGDMVVVTVDGVVTQEYPLNKDLTADIKGVNGGTNHLVIKDGYADVTEASCPDKICVKSRKINKTGESIICLPNKVVVKIVGRDTPEVDGSTN